MIQESTITVDERRTVKKYWSFPTKCVLSDIYEVDLMLGHHERWRVPVWFHQLLYAPQRREALEHLCFSIGPLRASIVKPCVEPTIHPSFMNSKRETDGFTENLPHNV